MLATPKDDMIHEAGSETEDLKESAARIKKKTAEAASAVKGDLNHMARDAGRHVREITDTAAHGLSEAADTVSATIKEKPVQATVAALLAGVVLGMLLRR